MKRLHILTALAASLAASTAISAPLAAQDSAKPVNAATSTVNIDAVLADPRRAEDAPRDIYRHPKETLAFFGLTPEMSVGEYAPGGGWYTRVIAPYVMDKGKYVGLYFNPEPLPFPEESKIPMRKWAAEFPAKVAEWTGKPADTFAAYSTGDVPESADGTLDLIVVPRMMHNLMRWNVADNEIKAMRAMLKPGGQIGIVQHRAKDDAPFSYADGNHGYLRTDTVVSFMKANGFELVKQSEINANPKDTADYPDGVWTLPPSYALKDADKAKYEAIGESDRMTLLFKKLP